MAQIDGNAVRNALRVYIMWTGMMSPVSTYCAVTYPHMNRQQIQRKLDGGRPVIGSSVLYS